MQCLSSTKEPNLSTKKLPKQLGSARGLTCPQTHQNYLLKGSNESVRAIFNASPQEESITNNIKKEEAALKVAPNPFTDQITVEIISDKIDYLSLKNSLGQQILDVEVKERKLIQLDLQDLDTGLYFLEAYDHQQQRIDTQKILKAIP